MAYVHFKHTWLQCRFPHTLTWEGESFHRSLHLGELFCPVPTSCLAHLLQLTFVFVLCRVSSNPEPWGFYAFKSPEPILPKLSWSSSPPALSPDDNSLISCMHQLQEKNPATQEGTYMGEKKPRLYCLERRSDLFQNLLISVNIRKTLCLSDHYAFVKKIINPWCWVHKPRAGTWAVSRTQFQTQ